MKTLPSHSTRSASLYRLIILSASLACATSLTAQSPQNPPPQTTPAQSSPSATPAAPTTTTPETRPIAIVSLDDSLPNHALDVSGDLQVHDGRAFVNANAAITSGKQTTQVTLPYRGTLLICAYTIVKLAADFSTPSAPVPALLLAMDHGAVEMSFATTHDSDQLLTPDFRILISGPGASELKVRLGPGGDTCVDNPGANAPYVLVSSIFDGGAYRVQPGQRVMFQHGSLHEVNDQEKESCGCPPAETQGNEFPVAQSEGLAPLPKPAPTPESKTDSSAPAVEPLVYNSTAHAPQPAPLAQPASDSGATPDTTPATPPKPQKKPGFFKSIGNFFRKIFGAD